MSTATGWRRRAVESVKDYAIFMLNPDGRILGVITFISADPARRYTEEDLRFAEEVGRRAALTIDAVHSHRMIGAREDGREGRER